MRRLAIGVLLVVTLACRIIPGRDVRYEPTPAAVVRQMLTLARVGPGDVVFDLGSGDGRIPITAARDFGARGVGIEIDPVMVERANANARGAGVTDRVAFRLGDMYSADLTGATVVTLFLHPEPNLKLRPRLKRELPAGARVVSYMWHMGDWTADTSVKVNRHRVFLWTIPAGRTVATSTPRFPSCAMAFDEACAIAAVEKDVRRATSAAAPRNLPPAHADR